MPSLTTVFALGLASWALITGLLNLEDSKHKGELVEYESQGWLREYASWDAQNQRFLVSFMEGGLGQIRMDGKEETLVKDQDYAGNATLGFEIDRPRNRVLLVVADMLGNRYSALAAYDMKTWGRLFLTKLSGSGDEKTFADDVTVDETGNAYVTDTKGNKIWKVSPDGSEVTELRSPVFTSFPGKLPLNLVGLNGIVYHPDGFLLAIHSWSGVLFKVSLDGSSVKAVNLNALLLLGDGLALLSPHRLVVASGMPSARIVESTDGWESGRLTHRYVGPMHRIATCATVKDDGKVFISHMIGMGLVKKHVITEAVFAEVARP